MGLFLIKPTPHDVDNLKLKMSKDMEHQIPDFVSSYDHPGAK